jgi:hypothetical protein
MPIYLPSLTLLLTIQKERSPSLSDFPEQDATLQANSPVSESLLETSQIPSPTPNQPRGTGSRWTAGINPTNILTGAPRSRKGVHFMSFQDIRNLTSYHAAFAAAVAQTPYKRLYRNNLPPPPKSWKQMLKYPYKQGFSNATRVEYSKLRDKNMYEEVEYNGEYLLLLIWVFTYKFDSNGYLIRYKARLCGRGDL